MTAPRRILIIRPSALGDVCRTVPALVSLKRRWPEAEIDWLVREEFAPAVAAHPDLHGVVPFPRGRLARWWREPRAARRWLRSLREARYDLVIDLQGLFRSGLFAWATRAPRRVGDADARELGWLGLNVRHRLPANLHTVDRMLAILEAEDVPPVRDMRLYTSAADRATAEGTFSGAQRVLLVAPTSRWPGKRWPAERFAQVVRALLEDGLVHAAAIVGSAGEREQCGPLTELGASDSRVIDLIGTTSVGGLMAAVERSALVLANDSATLHIAVGFNRPAVGLFGPTRVSFVGPYRREADVLQRIDPGERLDHKDEGLGRRMMERIGVEDVLAAARARLEAGTPADVV